MSKPIRTIVVSIAILSLLAAGAAVFSNVIPGVNAAEKSSSPVMDFQDHGGVRVMNQQQRGTSDLVRSLTGVSMNIDTTDLPVGAFTVWWVIFNNPGACSDGVCGSDDTGRGGAPNPAEGGVLWGKGGIVGPDRMGHFSNSLGLGVDAAPGQVLRGPGLTNPMGAEIHLIVRYHGPADWSDYAVLGKQISTLGESCTLATHGSDAGTFPCFDPQVVAHKSTGGSMSP